MKPLRVLVCGGRNYEDRETVKFTLDALHVSRGIEAIIHGAATGADTLASWWATVNKIKNIDHPADWAKHGKAAGPIRNQEMIDVSEPDLVVAFPGGRGTEDMIKRARKAGLRVLVVPGPSSRDAQPEDAKERG